MASPELQPEQVAWLPVAVAEYITQRKMQYRSRAGSLSEQQQAAMTGFFIPEVLNTRILTLQNERVINPDFYPALVAMGFRNLPDQSRMGAITFQDVVVSHELFTNGLLFHELVHVEQYRQLGLQRFSELYVNGFLTGGGYEGIPLEQQAYALGARYERSPQQLFSVEDAVRESIRQQAL
jgi:hypothetical protein